MLTLNLNLLYTVVNVLILFLLLRKFLYKPVMGIIAQRQKQVDDALNAAETSKKEAAAAMNAAQDKLRNVDTEAAARRTAYEQQAEKDKQQLLADAQQQAAAILAEGKAAAEADSYTDKRTVPEQPFCFCCFTCGRIRRIGCSCCGLQVFLLKLGRLKLCREPRDLILFVSFVEYGIVADQNSSNDSDIQITNYLLSHLVSPILRYFRCIQRFLLLFIYHYSDLLFLIIRQVRSNFCNH